MLSFITVTSQSKHDLLRQQEAYMIRYEAWRTAERIIVLEKTCKIGLSLKHRLLTHAGAANKCDLFSAIALAVKEAETNKIILLGSDRIIDKNLINATIDMRYGQIIYPNRLAAITKTTDLEDINLRNMRKNSLLSHRLSESQNRMHIIGSMAFTKETFLHLNEAFENHGIKSEHAALDVIEMARRTAMVFIPVSGKTAYFDKTSLSMAKEEYVELVRTHHRNFNMPLTTDHANTSK